MDVDRNGRLDAKELGLLTDNIRSWLDRCSGRHSEVHQRELTADDVSAKDLRNGFGSGCQKRLN